jgi:phenylacetate-CoA ligase
MSNRLRGSRTLSVLRDIEKKPFEDAETVRRDQFALLSRLLAHAETKTPYYREMFRGLGITSRDIRNFEDFSQLPILTKDIIRAQQRDLIRQDVPFESLSAHHSGGSTGVPLSFYREKSYMDASDAGMFRNLQQCGWRPGEMIAFFWGGNDKLYAMSGLEFELRQQARRMFQFDPFHSGPAEMDVWLNGWRSLKPAVILGYASTIARFAGHIEQRGATVPPLKGVFTTAEKLYAPQREIITRVFRCAAYDCYGSSEVQNIAAECPQGRMHINADFVHVELDKPDVAGAPTPFLLTSLQNFAMPFIRYRNDDCGELSDERCTCGNNFPLLKLNVSRVTDNFILPGGRVVHGEYFTHLMYGSEGILSFQFHQTAPDEVTIWIVRGPGSDAKRERAIRAAVEQVRSLEAPGIMKVKVSETDAIPLSSAGKHRFTRSDVAVPGLQTQ